jgi:hypothetical protein
MSLALGIVTLLRKRRHSRQISAYRRRHMRKDRPRRWTLSTVMDSFIVYRLAKKH